MDKNQEPSKKCFCARCFLPVDPEDRVDIEGQSFHRLCSTCCVCRTIPKSLKMFYGHVFCADCFKTHVLSRFRGESPRMHSNSWWMQWGPGSQPQGENQNSESKDPKPETPADTPEIPEPPRKCICARCLLCVDDDNKVEIGGQCFHSQCAKCCFCHEIPTDHVKIYYGQVFCEECFNKHVLNRNKDNPSDFFKHCFDQWQNNAQFAENMREFLAGNKETAPFIFMMQGQHPPFCRCGNGNCPQEWYQNNEPKKSATPAVSIGDVSLGNWDIMCEYQTEVAVSDIPPEPCNPIDESANVENCIRVSAAEKIEKLTKYLHENGLSKPQRQKKWKNFIDSKLTDSYTEPLYRGWVNLQNSKICSKTPLDCPKCLWQCGPIYVNSDYL